MHRLDRPRRTPGLRLARSGHGDVLCDGDDVAVIRLNETAAALWDLCDGHTTVEEIGAAVGALAGRDDVLDGIRGALEEMSALGAVQLPLVR